jgi:hypothetical protein
LSPPVGRSRRPSGGILWFLLLMSTAADTVIFSRNYPLLIGLNIVLALAMLGLVGWQLRSLWRDYRPRSSAPDSSCA